MRDPRDKAAKRLECGAANEDFASHSYARCLTLISPITILNAQIIFCKPSQRYKTRGGVSKGAMRRLAKPRTQGYALMMQR